MADPQSAIKAQQQRQLDLQQWFNAFLSEIQSVDAEVQLQPLSGDASFRRYFTGTVDEETYVLVDAPPDKEDSRTFAQVAESFARADINVPEIFKADYERGFLCLSFLGDTLLLEKLKTLKAQNGITEANVIYQQASRYC